jgi:hypothetical protein
MSKMNKNKNHRFEKRSHAPRKDAEVAMIYLTYGEKSNLLRFSKLALTIASRKFGKLAVNVLKNLDYGLPELPDRADYEDGGMLGVAQYQEDLREYHTELRKVTDKKAELYYFVWGWLSPESEDAVKRRPDYDEFDGVDPLALWNAIRETHGVNENYQDEVMMRMDTRKKLKNCRQDDFESITDYHERFLFLVNAVNDTQENDVDAEDVAMDFFDNLNDRSYGEFKAQFTNDVNQGKVTRPDNLADMYGMASRFIPTVKPLKASGTAAFATHVKGDEEDHSGWQQQDRGQKRHDRGKPSSGERGSEQSKKKDAANKDNVKCFNCQGMGHYANECPSKSKTQVKWTCALPSSRFKWSQVLLDNQADRSIVHPNLLSNLRGANAEVTGITGDTIPITMCGDLYGFFECLASEDTGVSVLSFAEVEAKFDVSYVRKKCFIVHLPGLDLIFRRKRKMYVADMSEWAELKTPQAQAHVATSAQLEQGFTVREVKKAREAAQFMHNAGVASEVDAVNMLNDGGISGLDITAADVRNAGKLYGPATEFQRGKMTQKAVKRAPVDPHLKDCEHIVQSLTSDVMHMGGKKYLASLCEPLSLLIISPMETLTAESLLQAIRAQVNLISSRGYKAGLIHMDPQPGFRSLSGAIDGLEFDEGGAGDHSEKIDQKIRRLKEIVRCTHAGIPWTLPKALLNDIVFYAANRMNMRRPQRRTGGNFAPPRVLFTGRKPNYKKEFSITFGDYVECYKPGVKSNNALADRSEPCLALYPTGNASGSWYFFNIKTRRRVRRTNWKKMVTTPLVIDAVNNLSAEEMNGLVVPDGCDDEDPSVQLPIVRAAVNPPADVQQGDTGVMDTPEVTDIKVDHYDDSDDESMPGLVPDSDDDDGDDDDDEPPDLVSKDDSDSEDEDEEPVQVSDRGDVAEVSVPRASARIASRLKKLDRCSAHHMSVRRGLSEYGDAAHEAIVSELKQLFVAKKAMHPIMRSDLSAEQRKKIIRSFMFLKAKFDGMGVFEKIKARLVANGSQQDMRPKVETASPTVAMDSVFMCLAIAAKEKRNVATMDIGGAYLNADMDDEDVFMQLDPDLSKSVVCFMPECKEYIERDILTVKLDKALYGCVQSALLWYQTLSDYLKSLGFVANPVDQCVLNLNWKDTQLTVMLYVDDLLITCVDDGAIDWLMDKLVDRFKDVKLHREKDLSYLGMHVKWSASEDGYITVSMAAYVDKLLEEYPVTGGATSGATVNIFETDKLPPLCDRDKKGFHTVVAKLLFLANRTRPDIMLPVSYLTTRVTAPTTGDLKKLNRVLKYLKSTRDKVLYMRGVGDNITFAIDAAFALHEDGMSHTGVVGRLFGDTVIVKSCKQKIVTRDSTESELVALSDKVLLPVRCAEFVAGQGIDIGVPVIEQDNTSTISLVTNGGGKFRNKYMRVRQMSVLQLITDGDVKVKHVTTDKMDADGCTKPLQGNLGRSMVSRMLGEPCA